MFVLHHHLKIKEAIHVIEFTKEFELVFASLTFSLFLPWWGGVFIHLYFKKLLGLYVYIAVRDGKEAFFTG